eukprot:1093790-Amorphochlora_amoeboformis.AAC.2
MRLQGVLSLSGFEETHGAGDGGVEVGAVGQTSGQTSAGKLHGVDGRWMEGIRRPSVGGGVGRGIEEDAQAGAYTEARKRPFSPRMPMGAGSEPSGVGRGAVNVARLGVKFVAMDINVANVDVGVDLDTNRLEMDTKVDTLTDTGAGKDVGADTGTPQQITNPVAPIRRESTKDRGVFPLGSSGKKSSTDKAGGGTGARGAGAGARARVRSRLGSRSRPNTSNESNKPTPSRRRRLTNNQRHHHHKHSPAATDTHKPNSNGNETIKQYLGLLLSHLSVSAWDTNKALSLLKTIAQLSSQHHHNAQNLDPHHIESTHHLNLKRHQTPLPLSSSRSAVPLSVSSSSLASSDNLDGHALALSPSESRPETRAQCTAVYSKATQFIAYRVLLI